MSPDSIPMIPITDSAEFMLLYQSAQEMMKQYNAMVVSVMGLIALGIGWLVTSKEAKLLVGMRRGYWIGNILTVMSGVMYTVASFWWRERSMEKIRALGSVRNHGWLPYNDFAIDERILAINLTVVLSLYLTALALLHSVHVAAKRERAAEASNARLAPAPIPAPLPGAEAALATAGAVATLPLPAAPTASLPPRKPPGKRR